MKVGLWMLGAACVLGTAANAGDFDGLLTGGYTYTGIEGVTANTYDVGGMAKYRVEGTPYNVQVNLNYARLDVMDVAIDTYTAGGAAFWRDDQYALGVFGQYNDWQLPHGGSTNFWTYGLVGEWYPSSDWTWRAHIGGLSADGSQGADGGGGVTYYILPDLSFNTDLSYNTISDIHWLDLKIGAEYLISHEVPVSVGVSYVYDGYTGDIDTNAVMVRLTWHIGDSGTLRDIDRTGPLNLQLPNLMLL